ncbi:hypothetical protein [Streptomyces sp. NBC_01264]|uniref:hypothetical protein n=1 Tax=Streptomyces sp. NBC_01264 TaxID=2903804 RepID=UPI002255F2E3|nr:hypothetical protein [Streptomyces sp. NBC_01264]MCX4783296.1 hypothetical protein [Streptomyces sp. NBC_01264]
MSSEVTAWFPVVRAWITQGAFSGVLDLASSADPGRPLVPGQEFTLAMTLTPSGGAYRTYGYVLGDTLGDAVVMGGLKGLRLLKNGRYMGFAPGTEAATHTCTVKVKPDAPDGAIMLPRVVVGLMPAEGDKLIPSSGIEDQGYWIRRHSVPGRALHLPPGAQVTLPPDAERGLRRTGVGIPRQGMLHCAPDGTVVYQAPASYQGYDFFTCTYEDEAGHSVRSHVTIRIGDLGMSPGALSAFRG